MVLEPDWRHVIAAGAHIGVRGEQYSGRVDHIHRDLVTGCEMLVVELDGGGWVAMRPDVAELRPRC